jgi:predicted house-cleaning noncanonical NTP pyrophosphatase (MazG superfamily)
MKKIVKYNKLVRDRIPEIIRAAGWGPVVKILPKKEYLTALKKKLLEEVHELLEARGRADIANELVDVQEVVDAIIAEVRLSKVVFRKQQGKKRQKRGAFKKRLFLVREEK